MPVPRDREERVAAPPPAVLAAGGFDPCGGAGVLADLKAIHALGGWGLAVITAQTVQTPRRVAGVEPVAAELVRRQVRSLREDLPIAAIKTGMLATAAVIEALAAEFEREPLDAVPLVVDPVLVASSGAPLLDGPGRAALERRLLRRATLVTPNRPEAEALSGVAIRDAATARAAARAILARGARAVLIKGGHRDEAEAIDLLVTAEGEWEWRASRQPGGGAHGTGCLLAAAIATALARGAALAAAVGTAHERLQAWISRPVRLGRGPACLDPLLACRAAIGQDQAARGEGRDPTRRARDGNPSREEGAR